MLVYKVCQSSSEFEMILHIRSVTVSCVFSKKMMIPHSDQMSHLFQVSQNWNCVDDLDPSWKPFIIYLHFVAFFLLPLVVVVYCYVRIIITVVFARMRGKHRTLLIVFIILVLFFACWAPRSILQVVNKQSFSCRTLGYTSYITKKIAYLYFCINPVFYVFLKRKFKDYVCGVVCHYLSCLRSHVSVSGGHESVTATL